MMSNNSEKTKASSKLYYGSLVMLLAVILGLSYILFLPEIEAEPTQVNEAKPEVITPEPVQEEVIAIAEESLAKVVVYKSPTCGCCSKWIDHLNAAGFDVEAHDRNDMNFIKGQFGVSRPLQSCHTAVVDGYTIEGHVPAEDIIRLLKQRPEVAGLSVPGMPIGSPGMEANFIEPFEVVAFDKEGNSETFTEYKVEDETYIKLEN